MIDMICVQSSNIDAVGFDVILGELHVRFHNAPTVYVYQRVPLEVHERMMSSGSVGQFHAREIKNAYTFYCV